MARAIFLVYACIVDANGTFNTLDGYPKKYDSNSYSGDTEKARNRAYAEYHDVLGAFYKRDDRMVQEAMIIDVNTGIQIETAIIGDLNPIQPEDIEDE